MSRINFKMPAKVKVIGSLFTPERIQNLDQDMIYFELPGDVVIDVGWYPDRDPNGEYRLVVFQGSFEQQIESPVHSKDHLVIVSTILTMVSKYLPQESIVAAPATGTGGRALINGTVIRNPVPAITYSSNTYSRTFACVA